MSGDICNSIIAVYIKLHSLSTILGIYETYFLTYWSSAAVAYPLNRSDMLCVQRCSSASVMNGYLHSHFCQL